MQQCVRPLIIRRAFAPHHTSSRRRALGGRVANTANHGQVECGSFCTPHHVACDRGRSDFRRAPVGNRRGASRVGRRGDVVARRAPCRTGDCGGRLPRLRGGGRCGSCARCGQRIGRVGRADGIGDGAAAGAGWLADRRSRERTAGVSRGGWSRRSGAGRSVRSTSARASKATRCTRRSTTGISARSTCRQAATGGRVTTAGAPSEVLAFSNRPLPWNCRHEDAGAFHRNGLFGTELDVPRLHAVRHAMRRDDSRLERDENLISPDHRRRGGACRNCHTPLDRGWQCWQLDHRERGGEKKCGAERMHVF